MCPYLTILLIRIKINCWVYKLNTGIGVILLEICKYLPNAYEIIKELKLFFVKSTSNKLPTQHPAIFLQLCVIPHYYVDF